MIPTGQPPQVVNDLQALQLALNGNLAIEEAEFRRSQDRLAALQFSSIVVKELLTFATGIEISPASASLLDSTLQVSGKMALDASSRLKVATDGSERTFFAGQIQSTLSNAASALFVAIPDSDRGRAEPIAAQLREHRQALLSAEEQLTHKLMRYGDYLSQLLSAAVDSYRDSLNPARYSNSATNLRELTREFFAEVAPDSEVMKRYDFEPDPSSRMAGVTRKHRITYAIYGLLPRDLFPEQFVDEADEIAEELSREINDLSKYTHVTKEVLAQGEADAAPLLVSVMQWFVSLIDAIESGKQLAIQKLRLFIRQDLDELFTQDFFDELDTLSTHTRPQGASDVEVQIDSVDDKWVCFSGTGSVDCDLQWGSDSDVEKDDGAEGTASFPFTFSGRAPIKNPAAIEVSREDLEIDTSSFYE